MTEEEGAQRNSRIRRHEEEGEVVVSFFVGGEEEGKDVGELCVGETASSRRKLGEGGMWRDADSPALKKARA